MIIGYDGKRAVRNNTGLGNYSRLVIEQWAEYHPSDRLLVYTPDMRDNPRLKNIRAMHNVEFRLPGDIGFKGAIWRTWGIPNHLRADKVDVFHGLSNELPLNIQSAHVPSVVTIHDLIYRRCPQYYKPVDRLLYDFKYSRACRNADRIIAVSQRTKDDICELYDINPDKIDVIYQGCDKSFKTLLTKEKLEEVRSRLNLPKKFILQVGTIEHRKNLETTVRALRDINPALGLVAVGRDHHGYLDKIKSLAKELDVESRITYLHDLAFTDLPAVNQLAETVVYPSRYEGFGIPVLEALESCRPVIAATGSCLEEAGGSDTFYIHPDDHNAISEIVNGIADGSIDCTQRIKAGKEYATRFNPDDMVYKIEETYRRTIDDFNRPNR